MPKYLLSVWSREDDPMPPDDEIQADVRRRRPVQRGGPGRGGAGCSPAACTPPAPPPSSTAAAATSYHRRPLRRVQGADRRLLGPRGARPRRGHRPRPARLGRLPRQGRGPSLPGRRLTRRVPTPAPGADPALRDPRPTPRSSRSSARSTAGSSRRWCGGSATSSSPRTSPRRRSSRRCPAGPVRPAAQPGGLADDDARNNRAIDRLRRESTRDARHAQAAAMLDPSTTTPSTPAPERVPDERLRLIFTCCHPALARDAQVALTLRLLGGLTWPRSPAPSSSTRRRWASGSPAAEAEDQGREHPVPGPAATTSCPSGWPACSPSLYLVFNEGYLPSSPDVEVRDRPLRRGDPAGRVLATLMPDEPEVLGLLALMLLTEARRPARFCRRGAGDAAGAGPHAVGRRGWSPRGTTSSGPACAEGARARTRSRRPSTRSTPTPAAPRTPTGARSSRSTTSCTR